MNGRARKTGYLLEVRFQALYHHLLLCKQLIDQHRHPTSLSLQHDEQPIGDIAAVGFDAEQVIEPDDREIVGTVLEELRAPRDAAYILALRLHRLDDGYEGSDIYFLSNPEHLALEDRKGQGQPDSNGASATRHAQYLNVAAQVVDVAPHDVHSNSSARYVADGIRGREACHEDQIVDIFIGQQRVGVHESAFARLRQDAILVEAGAVVLDLDDDAAALMKRIEFQGAGFALARSQTCFRRFQPVVERIAHEVHQGVADFLQHRLVQFRILAAELEVDLLSQFARQIMHQARKAIE